MSEKSPLFIGYRPHRDIELLQSVQLVFCGKTAWMFAFTAILQMEGLSALPRSSLRNGIAQKGGWKLTCHGRSAFLILTVRKCPLYGVVQIWIFQIRTSRSYMWRMTLLRHILILLWQELYSLWKTILTNGVTVP
ncbi:hypothetical protein SDC9_164292 [bioreactor metagenome]|uniref:Uncharacterized protein n=1 Tax=bioreactor metagenome TaxID=1076179 RepID=A0A645FYG0_9ZZZZ